MAFTTPDNDHPVRGVTIEKIPHPYSELDSRGAFAATEDGLNGLGHIASDGVGARPRGPLPNMYNRRLVDISADQREAIAIAQQLLRKYGLLMVEKKMLLP